MGSQKLLAILGSPHENGTTARMLRCACDCAEKSGWQAETVSLYRQTLAYCRGCRRCGQDGVCVIGDDLAGIRRKLLYCDVVILAAPTYWANVPAAVKNLFDRLVGAAMEDTSRFPKPRFSPSQRYLLLTSCNTPAPFDRLAGQSSGSLRAMNEFFRTGGMKRLGQVTYPGARGSTGLPPSVVKKIQSYWK